MGGTLSLIVVFLPRLVFPDPPASTILLAIPEERRNSPALDEGNYQ
jgi:hypothetical protein